MIRAKILEDGGIMLQERIREDYVDDEGNPYGGFKWQGIPWVDHLGNPLEVTGVLHGVQIKKREEVG